MAVALDDLRRETDGGQPEPFAREFLNARVDVGVGADGARELADRDGLLRAHEAFDVALDLRAPEEHLQPKGHGLCMDAVRTSDARRMTELICAAAQHRTECAQIIEDDRGGIAHHDAVCRVLDIA